MPVQLAEAWGSACRQRSGCCVRLSVFAIFLQRGSSHTFKCVSFHARGRISHVHVACLYAICSIPLHIRTSTLQGQAPELDRGRNTLTDLNLCYQGLEACRRMCRPVNVCFCTPGSCVIARRKAKNSACDCNLVDRTRSSLNQRMCNQNTMT